MLTLLSSPYCGTSRKLSTHTLCISSSPSLFSHIFYISHIFLRLLHGTLSMERGHIQSIFRRLQNLALFAGLRPDSQECCRILFASSLHFLVVQASCGFLPLILSKEFFRFRSPQLPSSSPSRGSVWLEAVLNRLGYTGLHRLVQLAPVRPDRLYEGFCHAVSVLFYDFLVDRDHLGFGRRFRRKSR